ncbi:MAG: carboxylating nicotinate-nucleotide diphosphorylase [Bdellovibrionota bacterium]
MPVLHRIQLDPIVSRALEEDWGHGDWTTDLCVAEDSYATAKIITKQPNIVASGVEVAIRVFEKVDPDLKIVQHAENGQELKAGDLIIEIAGKSRSILKAERVALNFLGRLSGIATETKKYVRLLEGTETQLLDTRKTTPGLRLLEKSATVVGGARNHRLCLTDGVMVKENHIRAAGGITEALNRLVESLPPTLKIEVETTNLDEVQEAIEAGADLIMLDNMSISEMALAVRTVRGRALLEASGNITLDNLRQVAETGVNFVSTSAILHSSKWADLSLLFNV